MISLFLVPMTMDYLTPEVYGIWLTVSSVIVWLNFFDIGFNLGLKNKLAEAIANEDMHRGKTLVSTTYAMMLIIFIPLCIILEVATPLVNWSSFFNVDPGLNSQLAAVMKIMVFCFTMQMIFNTITAILSAYQRSALASVFPVIGNTISAIVIYVLTKTVPPSLVSLAEAISYIPVIVLAISSIVLFRGSLKEVSPSLKLFDRGSVRSLFSLGGKFFLIQIQMLVLYQATNILISNISSPEEVTAYNIAYKYLNVAMMVFCIILGPLWPAFTDAYSKKDFNWMRRTYRRMTGVFGLHTAGVVVMVAVSPFVYKLWIHSTDIVPWFMSVSVGIYTIAMMWCSLQCSILNGIGAVRIQTLGAMVGLLLHIPLSFFIGRFIGGAGVVWSLIIINLIYIFLYTFQAHKLLDGVTGTIWNK